MTTPRLTAVAYRMDPPLDGVEIRPDGRLWFVTDTKSGHTFLTHFGMVGYAISKYPTAEAAAAAYAAWFAEQRKAVKP